MRVNGEWRARDDNEIRPVMPAMVKTADGTWAKLEFLLDCGADRTVFSARLLNRLRPLEKNNEDLLVLSGIGGDAGAITIETVIAFKGDDGREIRISGTFWVFTQMETSDIAILGRDVTNNFAVVYDYPNMVVVLLAGTHSYEIKSVT